MSKPNCFSSSAMNFGSRPCAPRYREEIRRRLRRAGADLAAAAAECARSRPVDALQLRDHALDRAARRELHDDERDQPGCRRSSGSSAGGGGRYRRTCRLVRVERLSAKWRAARWPSSLPMPIASAQRPIVLAFSSSHHQVPGAPVPSLGGARAGRRRPNGRPSAVSCTTSAPNIGRRAARGRARGRRCRARSRELRRAIVSISASTTGSATPARLREPFCAAAADAIDARSSAPGVGEPPKRFGDDVEIERFEAALVLRGIDDAQVAPRRRAAEILRRKASYAAA